MEVLCAFKSMEMAKTINNMSAKDIDTALKYVYRGMGVNGDINHGALLSWHKAVS